MHRSRTPRHRVRTRLTFGSVLAIALVLAGATPSRAGDVVAVLSGGSLTLTSSAGDETVAITGLDADSVQVTPAAPTTLNGGADPQTFDGLTKDLVLALGLGVNQTTITGATIPGTITAWAGAAATW